MSHFVHLYSLNIICRPVQVITDLIYEWMIGCDKCKGGNCMTVLLDISPEYVILVPGDA